MSEFLIPPQSSDTSSTLKDIIDSYDRQRQETAAEEVLVSLCDEVMTAGSERHSHKTSAGKVERYDVGTATYTEVSSDGRPHDLNIARRVTRRGKPSGGYLLVADKDFIDPLATIGDSHAVEVADALRTIRQEDLISLLGEMKESANSLDTIADEKNQPFSTSEKWAIAKGLGAFVAGTSLIGIIGWHADADFREQQREIEQREDIEDTVVHPADNEFRPVSKSEQYNNRDVQTLHWEGEQSEYPRQFLSDWMIFPESGCQSETLIMDEDDTFKAVEADTQSGDEFSIKFDAERDKVTVCRVASDLPRIAAEDSDRIILQSAASNN